MNIKNKGVTLAELLVAITIIGVVILGYIGSFNNISKALVSSKARTLATNLAQEKIQILRQLPYYRVLITPQPSYLTQFSPPIPYDTEYFPPERILEGGIYFTRYTYIFPVDEINGKLEPLAPTSPDRGLKYVKVSVVYNVGLGEKVVSLNTTIVNTDISGFRGLIKGKVRNKSNFLPIKGAVISLAENIGCMDYSDENGDYSIKTPFGSYNVMATKRGFFSAISFVTVGASPQTVNFDLQPMSSGTVFGYIWTNDRVVISQVVGSTVSPSGFNQEYIELYNPTSEYVLVSSGAYIGILAIKYQSTHPQDYLKDIVLEYKTFFIPPYGYYLIANTTTITACGVTKQADAVFLYTNPGYPNIIKTFEENGQIYAGGGVVLYNRVTGETIDIFGWDATNNDGVSGKKYAPVYETDGFDQNIGLEEDEQFVRKVSTFAVYIDGFGNCYDSDNNNLDFATSRKPIQIPPHNSLDTFQPLTGRPAIGSFISCTDGLSTLAVAYKIGTPPVAYFELTQVATGTWSVIASTKNKVAFVNNVEVSGGSKTGILNNFTNPSWIYPYHYVQVASYTTLGFISGKVVDNTNIPLSNIGVQVSDIKVYTNSQGIYFMSISTGVYSVTANPNNENPMYVSLTQTNVEVKQGIITSAVDFVLSRGGRISGFVSRDKINPLPGILVQVVTQEGYSYGEEVSDNNGRFVIGNIPTGTWYVKPVLSSREKSVPLVSTVTVQAGFTVFAGTFTVTNAMGKITGKVKSSGKPIPTGVLIIASTSTITTPPIISSHTALGAAYFLTSSYEDGRYNLEVIGSTTTKYNLYGYYTTYDIVTQKPTIRSKSITGITVLPGFETSNQDLDF
ncbi:MAG: prepilin-type N-terminal cleavage/methylation domain-containing protein [Endomicrobiia bacterium]